MELIPDLTRPHISPCSSHTYTANEMKLFLFSQDIATTEPTIPDKTGGQKRRNQKMFCIKYQNYHDRLISLSLSWNKLNKIFDFYISINDLS